MKEILITSSVLILAMLLLRLLFAKKVHRTLIYTAWALVALRLLIPVQIGQLDFSVLTAAQPLTDTVTEIEGLRVIGQNEREANIQVTKDYIERDQTVFTPEVQEYIQKYQEAGESAEEIATALVKTQGSSLYVPELQQQVRQQVADQTDFVSIGQLATIIWLAGVAGMALWLAIANLRYHRILRKNRKRLDCDSLIPVYVSEKVGSPCLAGLLRPVIYLTQESAADEMICRHVLTHELTHYRHGDHVWALVRCVCLCVYWFDPLVWAAAWFSRRDCELACDEGALKKLGEAERIAYGRTLLEVVSHASAPAHLMQTATSMNETKQQLKERVEFIVKKPKWSIIAAVCMVLVCAIVAGCAAAGSSAGTTVPETMRYTIMVHRKGVKDNVTADETMILVYNGKGQLLSFESDTEKIVNTYDEQGLKISQKEYAILLDPENAPQWDLQREYLYTYNDAGQVTLVKLMNNFSDPDAECVEKTEYFYDQDGMLLSASLYLDGSNLSMECFFDKNGNLVEQLTYYSSGTVSRDAYTYTEDGKLLTSYHEQYGEPHIEETYFYDEAGRLVRKESIHICGPIEPEKTVYTYVYDEQGRCIGNRVDRDGGVQSYQEYTYDAMGNMLSYTQTGNGSSYVWTYDAEGRMLSCEKLTGDNSQLYSWTYDAQGNVIACAAGDVRYTFTYTWPEAELPPTIREDVTKRIAEFTYLSSLSPQNLAPIWRDQ